MTDRDTNSLYCECCRTTSQNINQPTFRAVLSSDIIHEVHPLREVHRGAAALGRAYGLYLPSERHGARERPAGSPSGPPASRNGSWPVASWMADEVTNHEILVLIGRQRYLQDHVDRPADAPSSSVTVASRAPPDGWTRMRCYVSASSGCDQHGRDRQHAGSRR